MQLEYVVAVDYSKESRAAIRHAVETASFTGAAVHLVHIADQEVFVESNSNGTDGELVKEGFESAEERGQRAIEMALKTVEEHELDVETEKELIHGTPDTSFIEYVEKIDADGIFVGHRALDTHSAVGSFAKRIVNKTTRPVTIVKNQSGRTVAKS